MAWTLFLDDIRFPADVKYNYGPYRNVVICRDMADAMKRISKEAKGLRKLLKECREEMGTACCPHCGEKL